MTANQEARRGNLGLLTGSLFVVLWFAGTIVQGSSGAGFPRPTDEMAKVGDIMRAGASTMETTGGLFILSAVALLCFTAILTARLRRDSRPGWLPELALAGGITSAVALLAGAAATVATGSTDLATDDATATLLYQLSFWLGGPIHIAGFGMLILAAASGLALPKWLRVPGLVIGAAGALAALSPLASQLVLFTPIGRFLGFIWLIVATAVVAFRRRTPAPASVSKETAEV